MAMMPHGWKRFSSLAALVMLTTACGHTNGLTAAALRGNAVLGAQEALTMSEEGPSSSVQTLTVPARPLRAAPQPVGGNAAQLSVSPVETLPAVKAFINGAQHSLWIEMFEFGGTYAPQIVPLIVAKARAGVQVKILMDQCGSQLSPKGIGSNLAVLRAAGVDVRFYPTRLRRDGIHWRFNITHRKLLLADGQVAMEGGTNFGTTFDSTTQDLMVRWSGPIVSDLYREWVQEWHFVGGPQMPVPPAPAPAGNIDAQVAVTSVPEGRFEIRDAVYKQIDQAQHEILVEQQYIWEDTLEDHLLAAVKRGVHVRVMVPGGTKENFAFADLNDDSATKLVAAGAEARAFYDPAHPEAHLHVKFFSVDGRWAATGSCNGDARSLVDHQELDVLSDSPAWVAEVNQRLFENDWANKSKPWVSQNIPWWDKPFHNLLELVDYLL